MISHDQLALVRSALFLPASNARAVEKAQGLDCDMVILDLEDSVRDEDKATARAAAIAAAAGTWRAGIVSIRINGTGTPCHDADLSALARANVQLVVVPKVESPGEAASITQMVRAPIMAMIETPAAVYEARAIAATDGVVGLIVGTNDLAAELNLPPESGRSGLILALQSIVLAARAGGGVAFDGVYNRLDDPEGFAAQCSEGRTFGFGAKTLIHPNQIEACNRLFGPSDADIEEARALIDAATGGAERFRGRMIEAMHVDMARRLIARAAV